MYNEFRNPFHTLETQREIAIGAVQFRDSVIDNLRTQISNLRTLLDYIEVPEEKINKYQFFHLNQ